MEAFLSVNEKKLKSFIYDVNFYDKSLKSLSSWWGRIALLGKINSLDVAATILDDMDSARTRFHRLQDSLISSLIQQHGRKAILYHQSRSQMAIDVLIRNLFERTADIGFLSQDDSICEFLSSASHTGDELLLMQNRLQEYIDKYSVYNDALLLSPEGKVLFQLSGTPNPNIIRHPALDKALLNPQQYVEFFGTSDFIPDGKNRFLYMHAVQKHGHTIGVVVLSFRFVNEIFGIFDKLDSDNSSIYAITDANGRVLHAHGLKDKKSLTQVPVRDQISVVHLLGQEMLLVTTKGNPYQEYAGPNGWRTCALMPLNEFRNKIEAATIKLENLPPFKELTGIFSPELLDIRDRSTLINNDLELIVLNGVITAARSDSAEFMPVLEAIKNIGRDIDSVFADSIDSLFSTILSSQLDEVRLLAELAVDILDRNLYERANDCRWWALTPRIAAALNQKPVDVNAIESTLKEIHQLYTVYHDLYVFDKDKRYVASSKNTNKWKGKPIAENSAGADVFALSDTQAYSVSLFVKNESYDQKPTYIYNGAIRDLNNPSNVIGGIGTVFDAEAQFKAILNDVLPREYADNDKAFAVFTSPQGKVISSSSDGVQIGGSFMPISRLTEVLEHGSLSRIIPFKGQHYLLGAAVSSGYREFKKGDGYDEKVIAWVMLPC